jgi:hypothetical protein
MVSIGTLLAFTIVCLSVSFFGKPGLIWNGNFELLWVPFIPIAWLVVGKAIDFGYSYKYSRLNRR